MTAFSLPVVLPSEEESVGATVAVAAASQNVRF